MFIPTSNVRIRPIRRFGAFPVAGLIGQGAGIAAGAIAGSAVPGIGNLVGAAVGLVASLIMSSGGPSASEARKSQILAMDREAGYTFLAKIGVDTRNFRAGVIQSLGTDLRGVLNGAKWLSRLNSSDSQYKQYKQQYDNYMKSLRKLESQYTVLPAGMVDAIDAAARGTWDTPVLPVGTLISDVGSTTNQAAQAGSTISSGTTPGTTPSVLTAGFGGLLPMILIGGMVIGFLFVRRR